MQYFDSVTSDANDPRDVAYLTHKCLVTSGRRCRRIDNNSGAQNEYFQARVREHKQSAELLHMRMEESAAHIAILQSQTEHWKAATAAINSSMDATSTVASTVGDTIPSMTNTVVPIAHRIRPFNVIDPVVRLHAFNYNVPSRNQEQNDEPLEENAVAYHNDDDYDYDDDEDNESDDPDYVQ